jgi:hypothetical protein
MLNQIYTNLIHGCGGTDYQAIYMPKAYKKIVMFFLKNIDDDSDYIENINLTIKKVGDFNSLIENEKLVEVQKNMMMLAIVDSILNLIKKPRTIKNRKDCASAMFFEPTSDFEAWLDLDFIECNMEVVKEVRSDFVKTINEITDETFILDRNKMIRFGIDKLKKATNNLDQALSPKIDNN